MILRKFKSPKACHINFNDGKSDTFMVLTITFTVSRQQFLFKVKTDRDNLSKIECHSRKDVKNIKVLL